MLTPFIILITLVYTLLLCFLIVIKYNKLCMGLLSLSYRVRKNVEQGKIFRL